MADKISPDSRPVKLALAAKYFTLLADATNLEAQARALREEAEALKRAHPLLVNLDNRLDSFGSEKKRKKEKAESSNVRMTTEEDLAMTLEAATVSVKKRKESPVAHTHYHKGPDGDYYPCSMIHRVDL
jgi:methionine synthase II (cobalamin-independent)